ncbi:3'-5' exonuclease [Alkalithermobacter paradoxus]|uniref:DNA polymerase III PolC-type n=1 Tax=Alkalithermobacter paradoxus TaxID=29349 RepID=A0A1V4IA10_9FIRM|nr:DNA polymerase III PolC-type [[Clostridium] thermoalcaliphilum]
MKYIIFDLELNSKPFKSKIPNEIIEIGAIKLNSKLKVVDTFQAFIKPRHYSKLFRHIKKKTNIIQNDIDCAEDFKSVMRRFKKWIGREYILCAWGQDDFYHLNTNCTMEKMSVKWIEKRINIQKEFSRIYNFEKGKQSSLKDALNILDIPIIEENLHRADVDAQYTSEVFIKIFDKLDIKK